MRRLENFGILAVTGPDDRGEPLFAARHLLTTATS